MSTFPHLLPYNLHATGQFRCFFRFQFRTRILTDLHIVRYSLSPVTSTRITIVQKLLRRNQQATLKIFTDPIKLECMRRHDRYETVRFDNVRNIIQMDFKCPFKSQHHQKRI